MTLGRQSDLAEVDAALRRYAREEGDLATDERHVPRRARVSLVGPTADAAVVTATFDSCRRCGCSKPAYAVHREPGSYTSWPADDGLWHA